MPTIRHNRVGTQNVPTLLDSGRTTSSCNFVSQLTLIVIRLNRVATYKLSTHSVHQAILHCMDITQLFGEKVRSIRKELQLSQDELADLCGLHRTYIGAVERGERNITLLNAEKIADALQVSLSILVSRDD